ncbi:DUF2062 domain-containing protein [Rhizobium sp. L1K21]|uniref:DUF2062 domain-containing protein n=1 Tax=Rhizobium sp. L1K21 TaxID=2954933 RepID=UPI0020930EC3|nr:DUF2062 domain-containing protein [Rhizobium sp. L1K21]MCO6186606.1 DUF2062 domain-containing protein [Rhizobium sp. L1K21]
MEQKVTDSGLNWTQDTAKCRKRMGVGRTARYHSLRILRLKATPHSIAAGVAVGVAAAFLPIIGIHIALAVAAAWLIGGNMLAATAATVLAGNPLTYPFIWAGDWEAGQLLMGHGIRPHHAIDLHAMFAHFNFDAIWTPVLKPMLIGSLPFSLVCAGLAYLVAFQAVNIFRARRQARLLDR